jgi:hypothetical protein
MISMSEPIREPTQDEIERFRAAWLAADEAGETGHRVEAGLRAAFNPPPELYEVRVLLDEEELRSTARLDPMALVIPTGAQKAMIAACAERVAELDAEPEPEPEESDLVDPPGENAPRFIQKRYRHSEPESDEEPDAVRDGDGDVWVKIDAGGYRTARRIREEGWTTATAPCKSYLTYKNLVDHHGPLTPCEVPADLLPEPAVCPRCGSDDPTVCCCGKHRVGWIGPHKHSRAGGSCLDPFHRKGGTTDA